MPQTTRVMIATPTPGTVKTAYMKSIISTMLDLGNRGLTCEFMTEDGSSPEIQRNLIATRFLDSECTHLMYVDADMMFEADLCARLLGANKPFIGVICTSRSSDAARIQQAIDRGLTFNEASLFGCNWLFYMLDGATQIAITDGLIEVDAVGFGAVLISRVVFQRMVDEGSAIEQLKTNERVGGFYNFFAPFGSPGQYIGEDISFCKRWRASGGKVWALADSTVYHIGDFAFGGSYLAFIEAINKASRPSPQAPLQK